MDLADVSIRPLAANLLIATGTAEPGRRAVGTAVFAGMLAASSIGIFVVPMLYVTFQRPRERVKGASRP